MKIPRLSNQKDSDCNKKVSTAPDINMDLHTDTDNFAPNEYRGVVNSSDLVVYKGLTQEIMIMANESILKV